MNAVHCPDCKEALRLPSETVASDTEVKCPLCGAHHQFSVIEIQLPPMLEVVGGVDANPFLGNIDSDNGVAFNSISAAVASSVASPNSSRNSADNDYGLVTDEPMVSRDDAGFGLDDSGMYARPRRRHPSLIKMGIQWIGGGALGLAIAMGILVYLGKAQNVPVIGEYISRLTTSSAADVPRPETFEPNKLSPNRRQSTDSAFVSSNNNSDLLDAVQTPLDDEPSAATSDDSSASDSSLQSLNAAEVTELEMRIGDVRENLEAVIEYDGKDRAIYRDLAIRLYESMAMVGETSVNDINRLEQRSIEALLSEVIQQKKAADLLRQYAPHWIRRTDRRTNGVVLVSQIANRMELQARAGYRSAIVKSTEPITIFGRMPDISPHKGKSVILVGAIESDLIDIRGVGTLVHVGAAVPLR